MRGVATILFLVLWATIVCAQTVDSTCRPAQKPDWERDGWLGRVKTVRIYKTWFSKDQETGVVKKGVPELEEEASYDPMGNQINWKNANYLPRDPGDRVIAEYDCDNSNRIAEIRYKRVIEPSFRRSVYSYDEKGRVREQAEYFADGALERLETYSYDDRGNRIEVFAKQQIHPEHFNPKRYDVYGETKTTYEYDEKGNKIRETHFSSNGSIYATSLFIFDAKQRLIKEKRLDKFGRFDDEIIYRYNRKGQLVEEKHYSNFCYHRDGQMCQGSVYSGGVMFYYLTKTTYKYDPVGNWIQQHQFSMGGDENTGRFEPDHILSRQISYY